MAIDVIRYCTVNVDVVIFDAVQPHFHDSTNAAMRHPIYARLTSNDLAYNNLTRGKIFVGLDGPDDSFEIILKSRKIDAPDRARVQFSAEEVETCL